RAARRCGFAEKASALPDDRATPAAPDDSRRARSVFGEQPIQNGIEHHLDGVGGDPVIVETAAVWIRHWPHRLTVRAILVEKVHACVWDDGPDSRDMTRRHRQYDSIAADRRGKQGAAAMPGQIDVTLQPYQNRSIGSRRSKCRTCSRTRERRIDTAQLRRAPRERLGQRAPARVAGANEYDIHAVGTKVGAASRSVSEEIAPGRITRGRAPMQSTTVDGSDGLSVPPSSTRSWSRATASHQSRRMVAAESAGGVPGLFALVDVIGSPYARISRPSAACDVQRTATPPSGPRSSGGTRLSPPGSTSVRGPGQKRAASDDAACVM